MTNRNPSSKLAHLDVCLNSDVEYEKSAGFERYDFINQAACDVSLSAIDLSVEFVGKRLKAPLMIAPMTGGVQRGLELNQIWARTAERAQIAMAVGSQRVGLENPGLAQFYQIRKDAPTTVIFSNIGAGQLCQGWGVSEAKRAVDMIEADALFIHLNAIQEACQGGDVDFSNLSFKIHEICEALHRDGVPVFAREVGFGISEQAAKRLIDCGVSGIDCAGAGGTSWAKVEALCAKSERRRQIGLAFAEWGIPTATSILNVRAVSKTIPLIATGGLRSGIDVAKAIALGANMGAMARPMLVAGNQGQDALDQFVDNVIDEIRVCMFGVGAKTVDNLHLASNLRVLE